MKASSLFLLLVVLQSGIQASYFSDGTYQTVGSKYVLVPGVQEFEWRGIENATQIVEFNEYAYETHDYYDQDDDAFYDVNLGFNFGYYGNVYSRLHITSNGIIAFLVEESKDAVRAVHSRYANVDFENSKNPLKAVIAPFWDDLYLGDGSFYYEITGEDGNHEFIITWNNVHAIGASGENGITFQVVLQEASGDILFNYRDVEMGSDIHDYGSSATVGMTNDDFSAYTSYSFNEPSLENHLTLRFSYEPNLTYPRLVSPTNGDYLSGNSLEVVWDYGGQIPVQTFVYLGTEPGLGDIAAHEIRHFDVSQFKHMLKSIPLDQEKRYVTLIVDCEDAETDSFIRYTDTVKILAQLKQYQPFVKGRYLESGSSISAFSDEYRTKDVRLWKVEKDGVCFVDSRTLDFEGNFRFSNVEEGRYQLTVENSVYGSVESKQFEVLNELTEVVIDIPRPFHVSMPKNNGMLDRKLTKFEWEVAEGSKSMFWILKDKDGIEILSREMDFDHAGRITYVSDYPFEIQKQYLWDLIAFDESGEVVQESRNLRFTVVGKDSPFFVSPQPGESYPFSRAVEFVFYDGDENRNVTGKLELSDHENGKPFYQDESSRYSGMVVSLVSINNPETIYAKITLNDDEANTIHTHFQVGKYPEPRLIMVSPEKGEAIQKYNQEFSFEYAGELDESGLNGFVRSIDILNEEGNILFHGLSSSLWKPFIDSEELRITIGVLPTSHDDLRLRFRYSADYEDQQVLFFPFKAYPGGESGHGDYRIDDTVSYEWVDATKGTRLNIKGHPEHFSSDLDLPFSFRFFGKNYEMLKVSDSGKVSFGEGTIFPYSSNISLLFGGGIFAHAIGETPNRKFIVQWNKVSSWDYYVTSRHLAVLDNITFQMILHETTNEITFQYQDTEFSEGDNEMNFGKKALVGIMNQDEGKEILYSNEEAVLSDGLAIRFTP